MKSQLSVCLSALPCPPSHSRHTDSLKPSHPDAAPKAVLNASDLGALLPSFEISSDDWTLLQTQTSPSRAELKPNTTPHPASPSVNPKAPDSHCTQGEGMQTGQPGGGEGAHDPPRLLTPPR